MSKVRMRIKGKGVVFLWVVYGIGGKDTVEKC